MGDTVFVACSLPQGLNCTVYDMKDMPRVRGTFFLRGIAAARRLDSNFQANSGSGGDVIHNHGITEVDADLWKDWAEQSKDTPYVKSGAIFAMADLRNTRAKAKEREKERTGLEPLDPDKPGPGLERADGEQKAA